MKMVRPSALARDLGRDFGDRLRDAVQLLRDHGSARGLMRMRRSLALWLVRMVDSNAPTRVVHAVTDVLVGDGDAAEDALRLLAHYSSGATSVPVAQWDAAQYTDPHRPLPCPLDMGRLLWGDATVLGVGTHRVTAFTVLRQVLGCPPGWDALPPGAPNNPFRRFQDLVVARVPPDDPPCWVTVGDNHDVMRIDRWDVRGLGMAALQAAVCWVACAVFDCPVVEWSLVCIPRVSENERWWLRRRHSRTAFLRPLRLDLHEELAWGVDLATHHASLFRHPDLGWSERGWRVLHPSSACESEDDEECDDNSADYCFCWSPEFGALITHFATADDGWLLSRGRRNLPRDASTLWRLLCRWVEMVRWGALPDVSDIATLGRLQRHLSGWMRCADPHTPAHRWSARIHRSTSTVCPQAQCPALCGRSMAW